MRGIVRSTLALPLLPSGLIDRGLRSLIIEAVRRGHFAVLEPFFDYWIATWGNRRFFRFLSVFGLKHRTNNVRISNASGVSQTKFINSLTRFHAYFRLPNLQIAFWDQRPVLIVQDCGTFYVSSSYADVLLAFCTLAKLFIFTMFVNFGCFEKKWAQYLLKAESWCSSISCQQKSQDFGG